MYLLGQIFGIVGAVTTIIQPQFHKKAQILLCGMFINTMSILNFILIGHIGSIVYLCAVSIVQSGIMVLHIKRDTQVSKLELILFTIIYVGMGIWGIITAEGFAWELSSQNLLEIIPIVGAMMFMLSVFARGEQRTRAFLMLNGISMMIYTGLVGATTFFGCTASTISSMIALWRYHKGIEKVNDLKQS